MEKRTALMAAGAIALTVAGASSALALTLSASEPGSGTGDVGTYRDPASVSTTAVTTPDVTVTGMTVYVDENGNVVPAPATTVPGAVQGSTLQTAVSESAPGVPPAGSQVTVPSSTPVTVDDHGGDRDRDDRDEHGDDRDKHDEDRHDKDRKHDDDDD